MPRGFRNPHKTGFRTDEGRGLPPKVDPLLDDGIAAIGRTGERGWASDLGELADMGMARVAQGSRGSSLVPDRTDLQVSITGSADAVGIDTRSNAEISGRIIDLGDVSFAFGRVSFSASAEAVGGEIAFADAMSDVDISGADVVFTITRRSSKTLSDDDSQYAESTSETTFFAIDFEAFDLRRGPIEIEIDTSMDLVRHLAHLRDRLDGGNIADLMLDVAAEGDTTFASVEASVLTVEDRISSITVLADLGVA